MSSLDSSARDGAYPHQTVAPYAHPLGGRAVSAAPQLPVSMTAGVGPYVPAEYRGRPALAPTPAPSPRSTPLHVPSYPTPAYFTPVYTEAQSSDVGDNAQNPLASLFELPAVTEAARLDTVHAGLDTEPALPWIDAFLSSTPALPMAAIAEPVDEPHLGEPVSDATSTHEPASVEETENYSESAAEFESTPFAATESWALDEAADQMRALASELRDQDSSADPFDTPRLFDAESVLEPLPAWSDDDMIDIMPMASPHSLAPLPIDRPAAPTPITASAAQIEPWADRARRDANDGSEAAARALEVLAKRVRDGEISLAGYDPRLGDAAALAAALAALLGVRR